MMQNGSDAEAIRSLLSDYGRLLDLRDAEGWAALFAPLGEWVGGERYGVIAGHAALADFVAREFGNTPPSVHMLGNMAVTVEGEQGSAWSRWMLLEEGGDGLRIALAGSYADTLVRVQDGWRFARREVSVDLPQGA